VITALAASAATSSTHCLWRPHTTQDPALLLRVLTASAARRSIALRRRPFRAALSIIWAHNAHSALHESRAASFAMATITQARSGAAKVFSNGDSSSCQVDEL